MAGSLARRSGMPPVGLAPDITGLRPGGCLDHGVAQRLQAADLALHNVAGRQHDRARGAGADDVPGFQRQHAADEGEQFRGAEPHVGDGVRAEAGAVEMRAYPDLAERA